MDTNTKKEITVLLDQLQAVQITNGGIKTLVVIDASDLLKLDDIGADLAKVDRVAIYAENIAISKDFKFKEGIISCTTIMALQEDSALNVSGDNGSTSDTPNMDPDKPGTRGGDGGDGGHLSVYWESPSESDLSFPIKSTGGDGGDGQPGSHLGMGSNGGNGGNGGNITILTGNYACQLQEKVRAVLRLPDIATQKQEAPTEKTDAPAQQQNSKTQKEELKTLIESLPSGGTSAGGAIMPLLKEADKASTRDERITILRKADFLLQSMIEDFVAAVKPHMDVSGGAYGAYGHGKGDYNNGNTGEDGAAAVIPFGSTTGLLSKKFEPFIFVHPSQCERLLNRIKTLFLGLDPAGDKDSYQTVQTLLLRLKERTQVFADMTEGDELAKHYQEHEASAGASDSVNRLKAVHQSAIHYLTFLRQGLNVLGHKLNYVPLASVDFYVNILETQLNDFKTLEEYYTIYLEKAAGDKTRREQITEARDKYEIVNNSIEAQLTMLRDQGASVVRRLDLYLVTLPPLKEKVITLIAEISNEIKQHFNFDISRLFQTLTTLAFCPESPFMWLTQAGEFLYNSSADITNDRGEPVKKEYVLKKVKALSTQITNLAEFYKQDQDGLLALDDPNAEKLVGAEDQVLDLLDEFYDKLKKESLDDLKKACEDYLSKVIEMNTTVLTYNAIVSLLVKKRADLEEAKIRIRKHSNEILTTLDPMLPDLVTFMSRAYHAAANDVIETLDLTTRAFYFWGLPGTKRPLLGKTPKINYASLLAAKGGLVHDYEQAKPTFATNPDEFPNDPDKEGIVITIPDANLEFFRTTGILHYQIDPMEKHSPFAGMANIRLRKVRAWIYGATTNDGIVKVDVTHQEKDIIVSPSNVVHRFHHEPVTKTFKHYVQRKKPKDRVNAIFEDAEYFKMSVDKNLGEGTTYATLGPFTNWLIEVNEDNNPGLKLTGVTKVEFEFHGLNHSFG